MKLTEHQVNFFNTFGYLSIPEMFSPSEVEWITDEFEATIQEFGGGKDHDGTHRTMFGGPIERRPRLCTLLDDDRIKGLIGGVIGEDFNYAGGDGNYYTGDTGWHPDGSWGRLFATKVAFYLDPLTRDTGCLRIIPGSQNPTRGTACQTAGSSVTNQFRSPTCYTPNRPPRATKMATRRIRWWWKCVLLWPETDLGKAHVAPSVGCSPQNQRRIPGPTRQRPARCQLSPLWRIPRT